MVRIKASVSLVKTDFALSFSFLMGKQPFFMCCEDSRVTLHPLSNS